MFNLLVRNVERIPPALPSQCQSSGHCLKRCRHAEPFRKRIATQRERQGQQNVDLIRINRAHQSCHRPRQGDPKQQRSARFHHQRCDRVRHRRHLTALCDAQGSKKQDGADAVVEQAFASELRLQKARCRDAPQHLQHGDRVGG